MISACYIRVFYCSVVCFLSCVTCSVRLLIIASFSLVMMVLLSSCNVKPFYKKSILFCRSFVLLRSLSSNLEASASCVLNSFSLFSATPLELNDDDAADPKTVANEEK